MKRVTGIGGIFIKAKDPKALGVWYAKHLGIPLESWGGWTFQWKDGPAEGMTVWNLFPESTGYFEPARKEVMLNYIVEDLDALFAVLKEEGVTIVDGPKDDDFGKFGWIMDPEGNKIELWQPK